MRRRSLFLVLSVLVVLLMCVISFFVGVVFHPAALHSEDVILPNGDAVTCITSTAGGVECNWGTVNVDPG